MHETNQFSLLKTKRFLPLFITQFFGAFNDNVFKNALVIMLAFGSAVLPSGVSSSMAINISAGLFILPFLLFSSIAGQLADYNEKANLIRKLKLLELILIALCATSIFTQNVYLMWASLFLMGTQSTFFGPIKYSILPQHLNEDELVGGNSLIEMGTFISILLGTIAGGVLISLDGGAYYICALLFSASLLGLWSSYSVPQANPASTGKISFNIFKQSMEIVKISKEIKSVFLSILGISWFWFLGATFLSQFPVLVKDVLLSHENVVTVLLMVFSVGIALGSLACEKLSRGKIEPGLVPFGAAGMTLFGLALCLALNSYTRHSGIPLGEEFSLVQFLEIEQSWYVLISLFFLAMFGGFFTVPLYAMVQSRSKPESRSRTIAANNIINALFMIISAGFAVFCFSMGWSVIDLLLAVVVLNAIVCLYIFTIIPEFLMRFVVWAMMGFFYKVKVDGAENVPDDGAKIIVANHVSFIDALIIFGSIHRPVKFVMDYKIYNNFMLKPLFKSVGAIPIAGRKENEKVFNEAFEKMAQYLRDGEIVMIFPEGQIAYSEKEGEIQEFKGGIMKTLEQVPVPVIPSALSGLWGSMYSRKYKGWRRYFPKSFLNRKVHYVIDKAIEPQDVNLKALENKVLELRDKK